MKLNHTKPGTCWLRPSFLSVGTLGLCCATLLAVAAAAAPAPRSPVPARHAAAPAFRPYVADRYVVVLADPPVAARFPARADRAGAVAYRRQIEARQAAVASELASRHIRVTSRVSHLLNALFVSAPGHGIEELRAIAGVQSVTPLRRLKADLNRALQLTNAQNAWNAVGGQANAGKGIKIAILDSGIDLTNAAFQDSSLSMPSGFPLCSGFPGAASCGLYTNSKVIVARSYTQLLGAGNGPANSDPDDAYPHDRYGHGTATAMIAAGNAITAPAVATGGSPIALQGVASKAYIGVYKVSGTFGTTNEEVLVQALEDAVNDGMDVIAVPYGALATSDWASDPLASAFENAATTARPSGALSSAIPIPVILAPAGNDGADGYLYAYAAYPSFNTIHSPSNAPDVISVGASTSSHIMQPTVGVTATGAPANVRNIVALAGDSAFHPSSAGANIAPLVDVSKVGDGTACTAISGHPLANSFALIAPGSCGAQAAAINAQAAGAIGFIFVSPSASAVAAFDAGPSGLLEAVSCSALVPCPLVRIPGPAVAISNSDGQNLQAYIDANPGQQVAIDLGGQEVETSALSAWWVSQGHAALAANTEAGYSSVGPTPDGLLKPDLVATGGFDTSYGLYGGFYVPTQSFDAYDSELVGGMYSANGFAAVDGTSFSTALAAGAAALAIQAHPGLARGTQARSLIVNSTASSVTTDDSSPTAIPVDAEWIGAGLLDAAAAANASLTAEPATVSFGIVASGSGSISKTVTVTNVGSGSLAVAPQVTCCTVNGTAGSLKGATVTAYISSSPLSVGATAVLTVTLSGAPTTAGEYSGSIALGSGGTHIPFLVLVGAGNNCSLAANNCGALSTFAPGPAIPCPFPFPFLEGAPDPAPQCQYPFLEGAPGADTGAQPYVHVTDQFGVPVAGASVTFTVAPSGVTLNSASGHPTCSPSSSSTSIVCPTDQFGWAWMDVALGSTVGQPAVTFVAAGQSGTFYANIQAPPAVTTGGVVDAADYTATLVPGSYAAIYGSALSDVALDTYCTTGACVYPISFDDVSVSFDAGGATYPGYPYFVSPGQVNLVVPWELEGQTSAQVKVSINASWGSTLFSNVITVPIADYAPSFFVSCGAACALDYPNYNLITSGNPARRGQAIMLYANSLGPVTNPPGDGVPASGTNLSATTTTPIVTIGGAQAQVLWSGLAPGYQGLYQINVVVPEGANTGSVPISIQIGGVTSPAQVVGTAVMIPVQ